MTRMIYRICLFTALCSLAGCSHREFVEVQVLPDMETLAHTSAEVDVNMSVTNNQNRRLINDDFHRALYTNRPSVLAPYPIVNTTGNPQ